MCFRIVFSHFVKMKNASKTCFSHFINSAEYIFKLVIVIHIVKLDIENFCKDIDTFLYTVIHIFDCKKLVDKLEIQETTKSSPHFSNFNKITKIIL